MKKHLIAIAATILAFVLAVGTSHAEPTAAERRTVSKDVVLAMLIDAEKNATASPYWHFYDDTADAISIVATLMPLFPGADGPLRTAAVLASVQWFESNGNVAALGDCLRKDDKGRCLIDKATGENIGDPQSFGLYQIGQSNFYSLGVTRDDMTTSTVSQTFAAREMMRRSFVVCRGRAEDDLLGNYASGGSTCGGLEKSGHRMRKAKWLFDRSKERASETTTPR